MPLKFLFFSLAPTSDRCKGLHTKNYPKHSQESPEKSQLTPTSSVTTGYGSDFSKIKVFTCRSGN